MANKLTQKQSLFCRNFIKYSGNATEAYRQAYNAGHWSAGAAKVEACRTLKIPNVSLTVAKLQEKMQEKLEITTETQVQKLENIYIEALADKEYSPAISAVNSQSKHLGLIQDKATPTININMIEAEKQMRQLSDGALIKLERILEAEYIDVSE